VDGVLDKGAWTTYDLWSDVNLCTCKNM